MNNAKLRIKIEKLRELYDEPGQDFQAFVDQVWEYKDEETP